ncbi:Proteasome subunit beta type-2 [Mitosporidium daphniae]|uniref:Beta type subunit of proteasome n=1 Tax=Mitosporidium daphniae TaxID=1485682 RepID=A0A098VNV1_9MICR|nr:beta type subunit of proteasome [Mitosporidium daphniae]KGG50752.1 beta type subunit of proteasome [Mitosporidium daphniae]|eukprot:XP_013237194.1 beta type subunit of proteasome [Mitosporidium daphniae]
MEFLLGIRGRDFVLLASDLLSIRSIMVLSSEKSKFTPLSPTLLLSCVGESGEADRLKERLVAESNLAALRMGGRHWNPSEAAHISRTMISKSLRTRSPYGVNLLIAGINLDANGDKSNCGDLFWLDHLGSLQALPFAVHGYGAYFCLGLLDAQYSPDLTPSDAIRLVANIVHELQTRFIVQMPKLELRLVNASGTHLVCIEDWRVAPSSFTWNISGLLPRSDVQLQPPSVPLMEVDE